MKCNEIDLLLKRLLIGEEKKIVYNKVNRNRSCVMQDETVQTKPKTEIRRKNIMLSLWLNYKGILQLEILPRNQMINSNLYIQQLAKLRDAVQEKRPALANRKGIII